MQEISYSKIIGKSPQKKIDNKKPIWQRCEIQYKVDE